MNHVVLHRNTRRDNAERFLIWIENGLAHSPTRYSGSAVKSMPVMWSCRLNTRVGFANV